MKPVLRKVKNPTGWLALLSIAALLSSCAASPEDKILGRWKEVDGTETMEFLKDGTVIVVDEGMSMAGTYKWIDNDRVKIELGGLGALVGPVVATVSMSGGELTFTMPDGKVSKYNRPK